MSNTEAPKTDHSRAVAESEGITTNVAPEASRAARPRSFSVADHQIPTGREEEWRFSSLKDIIPLLKDETEYVAASPLLGVTVETTASADELINATLAAGEAPRSSALVPEDRVSARVHETDGAATYLSAKRNQELADPVTVNIHGAAGDHVSAQHLVLETQESASATFVLNHTGSGLVAQNLEMIAGDNSSLTVISIQDWDDDAVQLSSHAARVGRDARFKHVVVSFGGKAVRISSVSAFAEPGGEIEQLGLYFSDEGQHLEHRLFVDHAAPNCTSNVTYKGALQGKSARSVWVGDVLIRKQAEGTNTYELNRNLVLTQGARADSVPNLEIETGEIEGAGHASATGRFDDEQLFYLRARGIPEVEARRLVVRGFFAEIIQQIDVPEVRERLLAAVEAELSTTMHA
ncbi:Fe-S cluster assembly protein SufD [Dermabacteraceae bacterium P13115]